LELKYLSRKRKCHEYLKKEKVKSLNDRKLAMDNKVINKDNERITQIQKGFCPLSPFSLHFSPKNCSRHRKIKEK